MIRRIMAKIAVWGAVIGLFFSPAVHAEHPRDIRDYIQSLEVGEPVYHDNLTIIPVYSAHIQDRRDYTTLDDALASNWLSVTEIGQGGQVPQVELNNYSNRTIFIMGGEIISGGKQDRIIGREVLLSPRARRVVVPVYCVEQNRWQYQSEKFYSKQNLGTWNLRSTAQYAPVGAQSAIWGNIETAQREMGVRSSTNAYQDTYDQKGVRDKIVKHERHFSRIPQLRRDTVGVVVGVGGRIVNADLFANPALFQKLWPKILKSSALAAIGSRRSGSVSQEDAAWFIRRLYDTSYQRKSAVDLGAEFSAYEGSNVNVIVCRNAVIHLSAFLDETGTEYVPVRRDTERRIPVMRR